MARKAASKGKAPAEDALDDKMQNVNEGVGAGQETGISAHTSHNQESDSGSGDDFDQDDNNASSGSDLVQEDDAGDDDDDNDDDMGIGSGLAQAEGDDNDDVSSIPDDEFGDEGSEEDLAGDLQGPATEATESPDASDEDAGPSGSDSDVEDPDLDAAPLSGSDADVEDDSDDLDSERGPTGVSAGHAKFTEGGKAQSFAKAFAKILEKPGKQRNEAATAEQEDGGLAILAESKSVQKRRAEEEAAVVLNRSAKKMRLEMRQRGHVKVPRRGVDPAHDVREKQLQRLATRGVVLLFNAVAKAQKQQQEAAAGASKAVKLNKASFLAQLKGSTGGAAGTATAAPAAAGAAGGGGDAAAPAAGVLGLNQAAKPASQQQQEPGWKVLQERFTGLTGGSKMKDWDRQLAGSDAEAQQLDVGDDSDDSGDEGW